MVRRFKQSLLLAASLFLALSGPTQAGMAEAQAAYVAGQYDIAIREALPLAEQGNASSQVMLGLIFEAPGPMQDFSQAANWYISAAEHGHWFAQTMLGRLYLRGKGVPLDYVQAYKWLNVAASSQSAVVKDPQLDAANLRDLLAGSGLMTPSQIAEAQRLSSEWRPISRAP